MHVVVVLENVSDLIAAMAVVLRDVTLTGGLGFLCLSPTFSPASFGMHRFPEFLLETQNPPDEQQSLPRESHASGSLTQTPRPSGISFSPRQISFQAHFFREKPPQRLHSSVYTSCVKV